MIVVDASVAVKWFLEDETERSAALDILNDIKASPKNYAVPELFFIEMLHVLTKLSKDSGKVKKCLEYLFNLGFLQVRLGAKLLAQAAEIATLYKLSGYDAIYVATASSIHGEWVSADIKALNKVSKLKIGRALIAKQRA